jgi:hypothetical protein
MRYTEYTLYIIEFKVLFYLLYHYSSQLVLYACRFELPNTRQTVRPVAACP